MLIDVKAKGEMKQQETIPYNNIPTLHYAVPKNNSSEIKVTKTR